MSIYIGISRLRGESYHYALAVGSDVIYSRRCETIKEREGALREMDMILNKWRQ